MNWSGSWSLQGLVPGLQQAARKAPLGLLECGSNRNKVVRVWVRALNHLATAVLLCLLQIRPETASERSFNKTVVNYLDVGWEAVGANHLTQLYTPF